MRKNILKNTLELAEEVFSGITVDDIVYFMIDNYRKVNKPENREELSLSNRSIASNYSDVNWASLKNYITDKQLGEYREISGKRRWLVNNLWITIKKVDANLKPSQLYIDDSGQMKLDLGMPAGELSVDFPLVIGYIPDNDRSFIKEIHVIKYKTDGNVDWNIKLYDANIITDSVPQNIHKDVSKLIKIKTPNGNVVDLFDRD